MRERVPFGIFCGVWDTGWGRRSAGGAGAFARIRGYLSCLRTQGIPRLTALETIFGGQPLSLAFAYL